MIVHILGSMVAGGNERLCLELIRQAPNGIKQVLITISESPNGSLTDLFGAIPGLQLFHEPYSPRTRTRFVVRLARRLRRLNPRGVIVYPFGLHLLVSLASKVVPGCRLIVHAGNPPPLDGRRRGLFRLIVQASWWLNASIWSCSETVHQQFSKLGVDMPRQSRAQPNGINIAALQRDAAHGRALRTERGPILAMVARLDTIKDHDTLLAAFSQVLHHEAGAKLWIIGDGDRRQILERQASARGLERSVSFLGIRQDVGRLLGQIDLFVFSTTRAEGFGIALAEAMAVGLPIIASDVDACREVLADGACGELVPPTDDRALADAILRLLKNPARMRDLGAAGAERAHREYDIDACAAQYYNYLLRGREAASHQDARGK